MTSIISPKTPQTVVLTGADGGMGRQACQVLGDLGWHVLAIDSAFDTNSKARPTQKNIGIDLRNPDLATTVLEALKNMPPVTALVNLAGHSTGSTIDKLTSQDWLDSFAINVTPAMQLTQALAPLMTNGGSIVNAGSPVGLIGARKPSYAASKAALLGLTMACARNLGPAGIRVNLLLPGPTITKMTHDWSPEKQADIAQNCFLKRLCEPQEIANTLAFLIGPASSYITGSIIDLTGGSMYGH